MELPCPSMSCNCLHGRWCVDISEGIFRSSPSQGMKTNLGSNVLYNCLYRRRCVDISKEVFRPLLVRGVKANPKVLDLKCHTIVFMEDDVWIQVRKFLGPAIIRRESEPQGLRPKISCNCLHGRRCPRVWIQVRTFLGSCLQVLKTNPKVFNLTCHIIPSWKMMCGFKWRNSSCVVSSKEVPRPRHYKVWTRIWGRELSHCGHWCGHFQGCCGGHIRLTAHFGPIT